MPQDERDKKEPRSFLESLKENFKAGTILQELFKRGEEREKERLKPPEQITGVRG